ELNWEEVDDVSSERPNAKPEADSQDVITPVLICANQIEAKPVEWLWPGKLPLGMLTLFVGYGGVGKGILLAYVASRVSAGRPFADEPPDSIGTPGDVLILTAEESLSHILKPRLEAAGADHSRVRIWARNVSKNGLVVPITLEKPGLLEI